mmetsp:Transcript_8426/g.25288  ORF Transcript_8426/g.25288 Transcript_8426/m.25288 type:complete len:180 (-) Transcript_8426:123-662(-)
MHVCRGRQAGGVQGISAGAAIFNPRSVQQTLMSLITTYPGVRYRLVRDAAEAAEYCVLLTRALAKQPYEPQDDFLATHGGNGGASGDGILSREREVLARCLQVVPHMGVPGQQALAAQHASLGALMASLLDDSRRSEAEKIDSIANVQPRGSQRRIGPSAAKKLINLLTTLDPDAPFVD